MIRNIDHDPALPLHDPLNGADGLNEQINEFQKPLKALVGLGNQDGRTIAVYNSRIKAGPVVLKPGGPIQLAGMAVAATGTVYVVNQLQTVTAYRATD